MNQTLLVVGALAITGALVFQQQQSQQHTEVGLVEDKVAVGAHRVAVDWLAAHADLPFDPALVGVPELTDRLLLTQPIMATCATGAVGCPATLNDLSGQIEHVVQTVGETAVDFRVVSHVTYALADGSDATTTLPTRHKKVTVTVTAPDLPESIRPDPVHLSELYACGSGCAW